MDLKENVNGLRNSSHEDFKILYDTYRSNLYDFIYGLLKSKSMSEDIVQDTFEKVWMNRESIDPEQSFKSYLFTVSRNLVMDEFRKRMNRPVFETYLDYDGEISSEPVEVERKIDFDLFMKFLEKAKKKLTPRQKEIFELNKEFDKSPSEIANKLNLSEQTVYNQLSSALKTIKAEIIHLKNII